jgi:hypothetical protein
MFSIIPMARLHRNLAFSSLLLLAACGGDRPVTEPKVAAAPEVPAPDPVPPAPTPAPPPPTPAPPPPPPPPPPDPAPPPPGPETPPPGPETIPLSAAYTDLSEGTVNSLPYWPEGGGSTGPIDGVGCLINEQYHIHALVSIYRDGIRLAVPAHLGLAGCAMELHTHDSTGIIHIETDVAKKFTLGQFFSVWGKELSRTSVAGLAGPVRYYVIDSETIAPFTGDPTGLELSAHREIVIVVGTAPAVLPKYRWPTGI